MKHANQIGEFSLGAIKAFRGHEGETCLQGTILKAGKKVATWSEDSWGGPHQFHFASEEDRRAFVLATSQHTIAIDFVTSFEKDYGRPVTQEDHSELVVSTIAQEIDLESRQLAQLKRWCAKKTVLKLKDSQEGEYQVFKTPYSPTRDAEFMKRYPGAEIMNKRFS